MNKLAFILALGFSTSTLMAQEQTPLQVAHGFMMSGDWDNAILVLNRAIAQDEKSYDLKKELALAYYYKRDFAKALTTVKPLLESDEVDEQTYQIGGNVFRALEETKDAEKMFKKALKKYPNSGPLYSEYGEMLWDKQDYSAIKYWEKGIEVAPSYAGNYYNAAGFYYAAKDKVWTLIYGEIFVNMEYLTERAVEVKKMLLATYKEKLFADLGSKTEAPKSEFAKAVLATLQKQSNLLDRGINIDVINMIRTRFLLDWQNMYATKFPYKLFDYQQQLLKAGMFETYNQWLFGSVDQLAVYDQWTRSHAADFAKFTDFQRNRVFKMPTGQNYQAL